jgi:hypothetical protein
MVRIRRKWGGSFPRAKTRRLAGRRIALIDCEYTGEIPARQQDAGCKPQSEIPNRQGAKNAKGDGLQKGARGATLALH